MIRNNYSKIQSRLCHEYMKFLDKQIAANRKKNSVPVTEKVKGTDMVLTYFKSKD